MQDMLVDGTVIQIVGYDDTPTARWLTLNNMGFNAGNRDLKNDSGPDIDGKLGVRNIYPSKIIKDGTNYFIGGRYYPPGASYPQTFIAKFDSSANLVNAFDTDGVLSIDNITYGSNTYDTSNSSKEIKGMVILNNYIYVSINLGLGTNGKVLIVKIDKTTGQRDSSWGQNGVVVLDNIVNQSSTNNYPDGLVLTPSSNLFVFGSGFVSTNQDGFVIKLNP